VRTRRRKVGVGGTPELDSGSADKDDEEAESEEDLAEKLVAAEHRRGRGHGCSGFGWISGRSRAGGKIRLRLRFDG
jgi:hypothetical protein